jgi:hypothetical protein
MSESGLRPQSPLRIMGDISVGDGPQPSQVEVRHQLAPNPCLGRERGRPGSTDYEPCCRFDIWWWWILRRFHLYSKWIVNALASRHGDGPLPAPIVVGIKVKHILPAKRDNCGIDTS